MTDSLNEHGVLITVLSLLMIAVFPIDNYDAWDFLLSWAAFWFGLCYIRSDVQKDRFGCMLGSLIVAIGCTIGFASFLSITWFPELHSAIDQGPVENISVAFIVSVSVAILVYATSIKNRP